MSRPGRAWLVLVIALVGGMLASLLTGDGDLSNADLRSVFLWLRTWRLLNALLAGGALAVGGVLVQGLFQNPLASPSIIGSTAGASLGGSMVILLWNGALIDQLPADLPAELLLPLGCLIGAWSALAILVTVTGPRAGSVTILLTGFILSSLFLSLGGLLLSLSQDSFEVGRAVVAFTLGGIDAKGPRHVALALPMLLAGTLAALGWGRHLDAMLAGEEEALALGVDVHAVRRWVIVWTATLTGAAVAIGGNLSFVGLIVPHALRPFVGITHRRLIPAALVGGAAFVIWADVLARLLPARGPVPLGVITGLIGAPLFLVLLTRAARQGRLK